MPRIYITLDRVVCESIELRWFRGDQMKGRSQHSRHTTPTLESSSSRTSSRISYTRVYPLATKIRDKEKKRKKNLFPLCVYLARWSLRAGAACGVIVVIIVIGGSSSSGRASAHATTTVGEWSWLRADKGTRTRILGWRPLRITRFFLHDHVNPRRLTRNQM